MFGQLGLISKKFSEMPVWVQIVTYFIFLALYVYLIVSPRFINGQVVVITEHGGIIPYRGANLQTSVEGRVLKFKTNESGFWSIPLVSRLPDSVRLQVFHEDEGAWHEVVLSSSDIWMMDDFRIEILNSSPWVGIERIASNRGHATGIAWLDFIFDNAMAGELIIPQQAISEASNRVSRSGISQEVYRIIQDITNSSQDISSNDTFSGRGGLSYTHRIEVIESIERAVGIKIPDEHWRKITTAGELAEYSYNKKVLQVSRPDIYSLDQSTSWPEKSQMPPPNERPVFK